MPTLWPWAMTLTLDFQGQILKILYLRNGRADWHGTKGIWVDRILDPHCDLELRPHPWPWPLIFKVKCWKSHNSGMGVPINMERKGYESIWCYTYCVTLSYDLDIGIFKVKFWNNCIPGMGGPINAEQKGYESIGCYAYFVILSYGLDLGFSRSNFENAISQEWEGRLTWNERDVSR